ncbi:hypothetical protein YC2023_021322 [Brassica napus]
MLPTHVFTLVDKVINSVIEMHLVRPSTRINTVMNIAKRTLCSQTKRKANVGK